MNLSMREELVMDGQQSAPATQAAAQPQEQAAALDACRTSLELSVEERIELTRILNRDRRPYLRERAAALLKIADGASPHWVALHGLLKVRKPDTVYAWLADYKRQRQLQPRPACRRAFPPSGGRPGRGPDKRGCGQQAP